MGPPVLPWSMAPPGPRRLHLLPYDVLLQICQAVQRLPAEDQHPEYLLKPLKRLSLVNRSIRKICVPLLLSSVCLAEANGGGMNWIPAFQKIIRRDNGSRGSLYVKAFDLRIDVDSLGMQNPERAMMLAPSLARVLKSMRNLVQLAIEFPEDEAIEFAFEFWKLEVRLPHVRELIIGDMCGFVVDACPNAKEIKNWHGPHNRKVSDAISWPTLNEESRSFIEALGRAPKLEVFSKRDIWSSTFLQALLEALPQIQSFDLSEGPSSCNEGKVRGLIFEVRIVDRIGIVREVCTAESTGNFPYYPQRISLKGRDDRWDRFESR